MFTIKHIDPNGNEFAIEAESYEVQWDRDCDLVRVMTYDAKHRDGNYTGLWAGVPARSSNCAGIDDKHTVYVMNRYGSTISTVHFVDTPPDHYGIQQSDDLTMAQCQANPDLVAASRQAA